MITRIEAERFRCLRSINQSISSFHLLVGPNASGKSAFLDVLTFLATLVTDGLETAVSDRTENFYDLVWGGQGSYFRLGLEASVPEDKQQVPYRGVAHDEIRYEVEVRIDPSTDALSLSREDLEVRVSGWPDRDRLKIIERDPSGAQLYDPEVDSLQPTLSVPASRAALSALPIQESKYPAVIWLLRFLTERIRLVELDPEELRRPSPPIQSQARTLKGAHLARSVAQLEEDRERFRDWIAHVGTALPELETVRTILRPEDRKRYLVLRYHNGVEVPSWAVSDGTLRLLALTLLAYLPGPEEVYLIEEPENGIHPKGIETLYQSLSSLYRNQVLISTHSPLLVGLARVEEVLCFVGAENGAEIIRGSEHPSLQNWKGEVPLSDLFAGGVLG
jgi:predicted ATPase